MKRAIALRYDGEVHEAPVVVATGAGDTADQIERAARDYGVAIVCDVPLADALVQLRVGDVIPEALYDALATILTELGAGASAR